MSYLPMLAAAALIAAVAAWVGALATVLWLAVATVVGYAYLSAGTRHQRLQYHGVRVTSQSQPELMTVVDEVMTRAGIRRLDGVWLVPGANAAALLGHRDWLGRRRFGLIVGLLVAAHLDAAEMRAVLAHEAGHLTERNLLRVRLCARRRHAAVRLERRGSRPLWWYWNWFLKVTREQALESERHADRVAVRMYGAEATKRALHRVAEANALHKITIKKIVRPLWDSRVAPATLFEAYDLVWTQSPEQVKAALDALMSATDSPGDTHPGMAERCGGRCYPLAPALRGDVRLAQLADIDRRCSARLAREQRHLMTAMSWPEIKVMLKLQAGTEVS